MHAVRYSDVLLLNRCIGNGGALTNDIQPVTNDIQPDETEFGVLDEAASQQKHMNRLEEDTRSR